MIRIGKHILWQRNFGPSYDDMYRKLMVKRVDTHISGTGQYLDRDVFLNARASKIRERLVELYANSDDDSYKQALSDLEGIIDDCLEGNWITGQVKITKTKFLKPNIWNRILWELYNFWRGFFHHCTIWTR